MSALMKIRSKGFSIALQGKGFGVSPSIQLTEIQRDFLKAHKASIIDELLAEKLLISDCNPRLEPIVRQKLLDYMRRIDETDEVMIQEYLDACESDTLVLKDQLEWIDLQIKLSAVGIENMVKCGTCLYWRPLYQHSRGDGFCDAGVYTIAGSHWSETLKQCNL